MARPHHATVTKAEKLGIAIDYNPETELATATNGTDTASHPDAKQAVEGVQLLKVLRGEYPAISVVYDPETGSWVFSAKANAEWTLSIAELDEDTLSVVLEDAQEQGIDPEEGYDEEAEKSGSVVGAGYKAEYAARGNPNHCGDWLAKVLERFETGEKKNKRFDHEAFTELLVLNEVPMDGKWAGLPQSGQKGWVGRYRMNGRQKLEQVVARKGTLRLAQDHEIRADFDWLLTMLEKHPKIEPEWDTSEA